MINKFKEDPEFFQAFVMIIFFSTFMALFVYFFIFPVKAEVVGQGTQQVETIIGIDPIALEVVKIWNEGNPGVQEFDIDGCNKATRIDSHTLQVTLRRC